MENKRLSLQKRTSAPTTFAQAFPEMQYTPRPCQVGRLCFLSFLFFLLNSVFLRWTHLSSNVKSQASRNTIANTSGSIHTPSGSIHGFFVPPPPRNTYPHSRFWKGGSSAELIVTYLFLTQHDPLLFCLYVCFPFYI